MRACKVWGRAGASLGLRNYAGSNIHTEALVGTVPAALQDGEASMIPARGRMHEHDCDNVDAYLRHNGHQTLCMPPSPSCHFVAAALPPANSAERV
eukprot:2844818-Amphidinium_carterae.1